MQGVLVAGGGLAGAAAAAALANAGVAVTIIEREANPVHKICGEFLSIEAQEALAGLGLDCTALGGHSIRRLRLIKGGRIIETQLPFQGIGISRRVLDDALLRHAVSKGAVLRRGHAIQSVTMDAQGIALNVDGLGVMRPKTLFLATGKHELRGLRRAAAPRDQLVGFKMYFRLTAAMRAELAAHVVLMMFRDGYAGLQLIENDEANFCVLVNRTRLRHAGGKFADLLPSLCAETPYLARMLAGAEPLLPHPLSIFRVPYGFIHRPAAADPGQIFRLGDQAGVIPSFTGDGMAIALHSAAMAAASHLKGLSSHQYHRQLTDRISGQINRAKLLYGLAMNRRTQTIFFNIAASLPKTLNWAARLTRVPSNRHCEEA